MPEMNDARYTRTTTTRIIDQPYKAIYMTILVVFNISMIGWFLGTLVLVEHTATPPPFPIPFHDWIAHRGPHAGPLAAALIIGDAALLILGVILPGQKIVKTGPANGRFR